MFQLSLLNCEFEQFTMTDYLNKLLQDGDAQSLPHVEPSKSYELEKSKIWQLVEINEPSQLRSLRLSDSLLAVRISFCQIPSDG